MLNNLGFLIIKVWGSKNFILRQPHIVLLDKVLEYPYIGNKKSYEENISKVVGQASQNFYHIIISKTLFRLGFQYGIYSTEQAFLRHASWMVADYISLRIYKESSRKASGTVFVGSVKLEVKIHVHIV